MIYGEGSYGCVVSPPVPCDSDVIPIKNSISKRKVSKIFVDKVDYKKEIKSSKQVKNIKSAIVPIKGCTVKRKNLPKYVIDGCDNVNEIENTKNLYQLVMPYGGVSFKKYFENHRNMNIKDLLKLYKNLLYGLKEFKQHKLINLDIKTQNILITPKEESIYIDFSFLKKYNDMYKDNNKYFLTKSYFPYPTELKMFYILFVKKNSFLYEDKLLSLFINNFKRKPELLDDYCNLFSMDYIKIELNYVYNKLRNMDKTKAVKLLYDNIEKISVYSFGILILKSLENIKKDSIDRNFITILKNTIHPNFEKRYNIDELINAYTNYLQP